MNARASASPMSGLLAFCLSTFCSTLSLRGRGKGGGVVIGLVLLLFSDFALPAESLQKIRIGFPSLAFSYMPFYVAREKGFFKTHGIESEYIQMRTPIQAQGAHEAVDAHEASLDDRRKAPRARLVRISVAHGCSSFSFCG